jgi:hypothetical protein
MIRQITPRLTSRDVSELPLLTLGAQLYGSNNNTIGKQATLDVFLSVFEIVKEYVVGQDSTIITVHNASKRKVLIALSGDPDIRIQEEFEGRLRNILAIEIKGGSDLSNAHNRAGEAEKSHRKAKKEDFRDYWTSSLWLVLIGRCFSKSRRPRTLGMTSRKYWPARGTIGTSSAADSPDQSGYHFVRFHLQARKALNNQVEIAVGLNLA